jgi:hypothetical protein
MEKPDCIHPDCWFIYHRVMEGKKADEQAEKERKEAAKRKRDKK